MRRTHPQTELIPYLRGELPPPDRERVAAHLEACAECRQAVGAFRGLLEDLERAVPPPPAVDWRRYRAELRAKLAQRLWRPGVRRWWWVRPLPLALATGLAGVLLLLVVQSGFRQAKFNGDLTPYEEAVIGSRFDLLQHYAVLERLDLLEDLDVIQQLDRLSPAREG